MDILRTEINALLDRIGKTETMRSLEIKTGMSASTFNLLLKDRGRISKMRFSNGHHLYTKELEFKGVEAYIPKEKFLEYANDLLDRVEARQTSLREVAKVVGVTAPTLSIASSNRSKMPQMSFSTIVNMYCYEKRLKELDRIMGENFPDLNISYKFATKI